MDEHSSRGRKQGNESPGAPWCREPDIALDYGPDRGQETSVGDLSRVPAEGRDLLGVAAAAFAAELTYQRADRGLSIRALAKTMAFDPSYISHIEAGRLAPTEEFARRADQALGTGDLFERRCLDYTRARALTRPATPKPPAYPPGIAPDSPPPTPAPPQPEADSSSTTPSGYEIHLRGTKGVQIGNNTTQNNTF
ncbi:helix-turn-helix domain-containing protein [Streptomyces amritsarensis]|uniref:helix-turn-helix domain-containing protein n=1 Tax=Streptomyces amritsarensis TaxID=681158 RepID=UPI0019D063D0|nr:helix-turn-helix transcriptional regulator [Streptomyces amritsarensis]